MTGPEHYLMAEQLLNGIAVDDDPTSLDNAAIAVAHVHATLALAAASALNDTEGGMTNTDYRAWLDVAGESTKAEA